MNRSKFLLCLVALVAFMIGYGVVAKAYPAGGVHGRGEFRGFRTNTFDDSGTYVLRQVYWGEAIRPSVEGDVEDFISFILNTKLDLDGNGSGDNHDKRGATFIIQTMLGTPISERSSRPTAQQVNDWKALVRKYDAKGLITWRANYTYSINSMFQGTNGGADPDDDAFYDDSGTKPSIIFRDPNTGGIAYVLKWSCANPVSAKSLPDIPSDFDMDANIGTSVTSGGTTTPNALTAEAGDSITFTYTAKNNGPGTASPVVCATWRHNYTGYQAPPAWVDAGSSGGPAMGCPSSFASGATRTITETVPATANSTICRFLQVTPNSQAGGQARSVKCVTVYTKPYFRVYGGDVESGANFWPACGASLPAGQGKIEAYSRLVGTSYAGSGAEGAVTAYSSITEFVSAAMRNSGTPRTPKGLTFANTAATGTYGGNFGTGSCIPDYWSLSKSPSATVNAGPYTVGGRTMNAGDKQDVFVNGDAYISGNIVYGGSWTIDLGSNTIPSFRLIVNSGNIYIDDNVTQLDGVYVAIPKSDGTKGLIYTCSLGATPPTEVQVAYNCSNQLRVNGSFIAKGVKLLRTANSLNNSSVNEPSSGASSKAAEVFVYSPDVWLAKPQFKFTDTPDYDAVTTLPPVL